MKILTAIDNPQISYELSKKLDVISRDVQYKEAIIEILEKDKNIDLIIINEKIPGEIKLELLIKKIKEINKKIKLIIFLDRRDDKKEEFLNNYGIKNIYNKEDINTEKIISIIKNKKEKNISENKIIKNNIIVSKNIISFFGDKKIKKDLILILLKKLIKDNKKVLFINLYINKSDFKKLFVEKNFFKKEKIEKININNKKILVKKIKLNKNIIIINKLKNNFNFNFLKNLLIYYNNKFNYIIINVENILKDKEKSEILKISDKNVITINQNDLGIKEFKKILKNIKNIQINSKNSLHIVENKEKGLLISEKILKRILSKNIKIYKLNNKKINKLTRKNYKNVKINFKMKNLINNLIK